MIHLVRNSACSGRLKTVMEAVHLVLFPLFKWCSAKAVSFSVVTSRKSPAVGEYAC